MKTTLALIFACALSAAAQTPAPIASVAPVTVNVSDLSFITINLPDFGQFISAGPVSDAIKRYPKYAPLIITQLESSLDIMDEPAASKRLSDLAAAGVTISKPVADKQAARIDRFRKQRESALMKVKDTDPGRAKLKLDELLAAKIPIDPKVQAAVNSAAAPASAASPAPTPNDGL
jgi:hypothetical protein